MLKQQGYGSIGLIILFFSSQIVHADWEHTSGPGAGQILSLAANGSTVFAGLNNGGIYRSTDSGENWVQSDSGLSVKEVVPALLIADSAIFAGTLNGLFKSTDNGRKWVQVTSGIKAKRFNTLALAGKNILAGTELDGIYLSTNNGTSWKTVNSGMTDSSVLAIAAGGTQIFAGTRSSVYRSTNNGGNWTKVYSHTSMVFKSLTVCGNTIIAGASPISSEGSIGVMFSTDGGAKWVSAEPGLKYKKVEALVTIGTSIYAATWGDGIHLSIDNGKNWRAASAGLTCNEVSCIAFDGSTVLAGTDGGVFRSDNAASNWTLSSSGITKVCVMALAACGEAIYAGTEKDGVFLSTDNGGKWTQVASGLKRDRICSLAANGSAIFAGTDSMGIFRMPSNGSVWAAIGTDIVKNIPIVDLTAIGNIIFAESALDIFRSTDNGERWGTIKSVLPSGGGSAFAAKDNLLFTGADSGVFRSYDNGASWTAANSGLSGHKVLSLASLGNTLFAGTYLHGIYQSDDDGAHWKPSNDWEFSIEDLLPIHNNIFGFSSTSVFLSTDNGTSWKNVQDGITSTQFVSFTASEDMLFVGTRYDGIWRRSILNAIGPAGGVSPRAWSLPPQTLFSVRAPVKNAPHLIVEFTLQRPQEVTVDIYSLAGAKVISLVNKHLGPGSYRYRWEAGNAAMGCYTVQARMGTTTYVKSVPLVR